MGPRRTASFDDASLGHVAEESPPLPAFVFSTGDIRVQKCWCAPKLIPAGRLQPCHSLVPYQMDWASANLVTTHFVSRRPACHGRKVGIDSAVRIHISRRPVDSCGEGGGAWVREPRRE